MRAFLSAGRRANISIAEQRLPWSCPGHITQCVPRRTTTARAGNMSDTAVFIEEIAVFQAPKRLGALIKVLEAQGAAPVSPAARTGLHPLVIPLAVQGDSITCLLRWPNPSAHKGMSLPVVRMQRGALNMTLVARSVDEYLHRLLAEESSGDCAGGEGLLAGAAGAEGRELFRSGAIEAAGMGGKLPMYLIKKVGMFPDVCESLSLGHLGRHDQTSAMVAAEWYMRNNYFPGWGRPYEFASDLFAQLKRDEEARDFARFALRCPWWTLSAPFTHVQIVAQLAGPPERVMYMLSEEAAAAASASINKVHYKEPKSTQQLAMERATALLNNVAAGAVEGGYASVTYELAAAYREAGHADVANFITAT